MAHVLKLGCSDEKLPQGTLDVPVPQAVCEGIQQGGGYGNQGGHCTLLEEEEAGKLRHAPSLIPQNK